MSPASPAVMLRFGPPNIRRFAAWHPEWWMLLISAVAWCAMLHPCGRVGGAMIAACPACRPSQDWTAGLGGWLSMILAMMLPLMVIPVRVTAFGSLWRRRHRAVAVFLAGYLVIWMVVGMAILLILAFLQNGQGMKSRWVAVAGFLAAAVWQLTPWKRRLATACHWTSPLAPSGWPADYDCLRFGLYHGIHCAGNCSVLMLAAMLSPWPQTMMIAAALLLLYERYQPRPKNRVIAMILGALAVGQCLT